ncbi:GntR family transcriptional regulator [Falsiporphyromonas endometrii]|uniref:GntR family transcriptional regulator n=1 Tax=Falsiporphyromonas endometrii TaxID=1387297 RepID=A0ABV9K5P6_9PORP
MISQDIQKGNIFLRIAELIKERILIGEYKPDERIPSVRDIAVEMEVNPNTAMRAYERLQLQEIIYPKRGMGFYVEKKAPQAIKSERREAFKSKVLPTLFKNMEQLDISWEQLEEQYQKYFGLKS